VEASNSCVRTLIFNSSSFIVFYVSFFSFFFQSFLCFSFLLPYPFFVWFFIVFPPPFSPLFYLFFWLLWVSSLAYPWFKKPAGPGLIDFW
jgi:hypothetical protein